MQIAHINNTAGIASIIAHGQKNYGNLVDVFVFNRKTQNLFGGTKINYKFPNAVDSSLKSCSPAVSVKK